MNETFDRENPVVAVNDAGLAVAIWHERRDDGVYIMTSFLPFGGSWTSPVAIQGPIERFREDTPDIKIDPQGNVVAVWKNNQVDQPQLVYAVSYDAATATWSAPVLLEAGADDVGLPKIAIEINKNAMVVWDRTNGSLA